MNKKPLVSIVIPVYNGANYMREAIDSALAQDYENFEVIVVNDGSKDNTDEIAKSYGKKIRYFKKENGGVSSALNLGIEKMKGEYFSWLSHDDLYYPNKISAEVDYLEKHGMLGGKFIPYSDFCLVDENSKHIVDVVANHEVATEKMEYALLRGLINGNSLLIPKKAFDKFGGFDTQLRCVQDYQKWFEMMMGGYHFVHVPAILIKSRYHAKQVSNTSPLVKTEGNPFWINWIKSFDNKTKVRLNGSLYAFYYHMAEYLKTSPYDEAFAYCVTEMNKLPKEPVGEDNFREGQGTDAGFSKNVFIRFGQFIKREGVKNTLKRVWKKLIK